MKTKKTVLAVLTILVVSIVSYILMKLFYPTYIYNRFQNLLQNKYKNIVSMYETKVINDYIDINVLLKEGNTSKVFIKNKIDKFTNTYPIIVGWDLLINTIQKSDIKSLKKFTSQAIYKLAQKIANRTQIDSKKKDSLIISSNLKIKKLKKDKFCILQDLDKDYFTKNQIGDNNILKDLATLSTYNHIFWKLFWKKDICIKYVNSRIFVIYLKQE